MRKFLFTSLVLLAAGCGGGTDPVTPELEAKQQEDAKRVQAAESARQRQQKAPQTQQQRVQDAESARQQQRPGR